MLATRSKSRAVARSTLAAGYTAWTKPICKACWASIDSAATAIHLAQCGPTNGVRRLMPPEPGITAKLGTSGNEKVAISAATRKVSMSRRVCLGAFNDFLGENGFMGFNPHRQYRRRGVQDYLFVGAAVAVTVLLLLWALLG